MVKETAKKKVMLSLKPDVMVTLAAGLVIAAVGFVVGIEVQRSLTPKTTTLAQSGALGSQASTGSPAITHTSGVFGKVTSIKDTVMAVLDHAGKTVTVSLANKPLVTDGATAASISSIKVGDSVIATGAATSDGSIKADHVRITLVVTAPTAATTTH
jgi:preprotein translocase subunit YajC